jgi:hypothetical protein
MFITYRRTGGVFALLTFAAVALATTLLTVAVVATVLIVAVAVAAAALVARAVLPASSWYHTVSPAAPWPQETIETTVVNPTGFSDERDLLRMDSDKR